MQRILRKRKERRVHDTLKMGGKREKKRERGIGDSWVPHPRASVLRILRLLRSLDPRIRTAAYAQLPFLQPFRQ